MSDYQDLVKKEAKAFHEANNEAFAGDTEEFGGSSSSPNLLKWIDRTGKLASRVGEIMEKWVTKELNWVQSNTRNKNPHGDLRSNSFGSLLQDIRHEIKKLSKGK